MNRSSYGESHPAEAQLVLALDGELEQSAAEEISRHLEYCVVCKEQFDQWKRLSAQIAECHAAKLQSQVWQEHRPGYMTKRSLLALASIAAGLVCFVWYSANPHRRVIAPLETPRVIATAPLTPVTPYAPAVSMTRKREVAPKPARPVINYSSDFISLPFSDSALPLNDATVVRVQLAAEELQLAGLPLADVRPGTDVQADLLIGIDGLPRAFRLIHQ